MRSVARRSHGGNATGLVGQHLGPTRALALVMLAFAALSIVYNVGVPVFEAPDEHSHYFFAQHVANELSLPVQSNVDSERGPWEQEGSQPPLYYLIAAPVVRLADARLTVDELRYNHQNSMGHPAIQGNENRFVHAPETEGWPWQGYVLAVRLARAFSLLLCLLSLPGIYSVARRTLPGREWLAVAAVGVVAFNPQFLHLSATVSNDPLIVLLATTSLALMLRVADGDDGPWTRAGLILAPALAPLAKLSGVAVLAFCVATTVFLAWRRRDRRLLTRLTLPMLLVAAAAAGWWYVRNLSLYGSITGLDYMLTEPMRRSFKWGRWLAGLPAELWGLWLSTWGIFGWFTIMLPSAAYMLISAASLAAAVGVLVAWRGRVRWVRWPVLAWLVAWGALVAASLLRWMMIAKGGHGRLMFPAVAVLAVLLTIGWRELITDRLGDRWLARAVVFGGPLLAALAWLAIIRPAFAWPKVIAGEQLPESARPSGVTFGDGLVLVAADYPARVTEGRSFPITLYWRVEQAIDKDGFVVIRTDLPVAGKGRSESWELQAGTPNLSYPGRGNAPPDLLPPRSGLYVDERSVVAPTISPAARWASDCRWAGQAPSASLASSRLEPRAREAAGGAHRAFGLPILARLSVHMYDAEHAESWSVAGARDGASDSDASFRVLVEPADPPGASAKDWFRDRYAEAKPLGQFSGAMELYVPGALDRDGSIGALICERGGRLTLPVVWRAISAPEEELSALVHLVDRDGRIIGQGDGPPATHGDYPTSWWREGEVVPAELSLDVPTGQAAGSGYSLRLGLYRSAEGSRLQARRPDGRRWPDDAVHVAVTIR